MITYEGLYEFVDFGATDGEVDERETFARLRSLLSLAKAVAEDGEGNQSPVQEALADFYLELKQAGEEADRRYSEFLDEREKVAAEESA